MFVEMNCGACESYFQVEADEEDAVWLMMHRFSSAHADCGFMTPSLGEPAVALKKKVIKPRLTDESEEA